MEPNITGGAGATPTPTNTQQYTQLSEYAAHIHSILSGVDDSQLEWYLDAIYLEYTKIRDGILAISWELFHKGGGNSNTENNNISKRLSNRKRISTPKVPEFSTRWSPVSGGNSSSRSTLNVSSRAGAGIQDHDEWPLPNRNGAFSPEDEMAQITPEGDPMRCLRQDLERLIAGHQRWLVEVCKDKDKRFTPEELDSIDFVDGHATFQGVIVKAIARSSGRDSLYVDKWETRFKQYNQLKKDVAELQALTLPVNNTKEKGSPTRQRRVILETITPYGDAILEFSNTGGDGSVVDDEQPILRFRVSSHMLTECSPIFARIFSKHPKLLDIVSVRDLEQDLPRDGPVQFSDSVQLWRMPQIETNKENALTILLHAAHMHNEHVPRTISFEQLVALSEAAIRYRCCKPLELFFEHCWLHQWIHKASDEMPDGLVTISYAFGRRRLFSRVTKSVILHLTDEEELRAKNWPQVVKDKIWAVRSAKMAQVYATCSETIEEYLRRPRATSPIAVPSPLVVLERPATSSKMDSSWSWKGSSSQSQSQTQSQQAASPSSPTATEQQQQQQPKPQPTKSKKDSWSWKPMSSSSKQAPVGSSLRPISRPVILPPPPPPPPVSAPPRANTLSMDSITSGISSTSSRGVSGIFPELFTFSSTPRCPKGSHWCDATNLGWLLLVYNELRLFSAILGPSALTGLSLSPNQTSSAPQRSLAKVLDALRGMANPPQPVHSRGSSVCDPVPAFRDAINDIYNSVTGLQLQEVDGATLRHRAGLSMPRLHGSLSVWPGDTRPPPGTARETGQIRSPVSPLQDERRSEKEEIIIATEEVPVTRNTKLKTEVSVRTMTSISTAAERAFREENICLNILRHLSTSDDLRSVAVLNHRTYNIYKIHEVELMRDIVVPGNRRQTMLLLTGTVDQPPQTHSQAQAQKLDADHIDGGNSAPLIEYGSGEFRENRHSLYHFLNSEDRLYPPRVKEGTGTGTASHRSSFSSRMLLSANLMSSKSQANLADPEGASTRAIKRASSEASSVISCSVGSDCDEDDHEDDLTGSGSDWNFAGVVNETASAPGEATNPGVKRNSRNRSRMKSECPSLDITEGLDTNSILGTSLTAMTTKTKTKTKTLVARDSAGFLLPTRGGGKLARNSSGDQLVVLNKEEEEVKSHSSSWLTAEVEEEEEVVEDMDADHGHGRGCGNGLEDSDVLPDYYYTDGDKSLKEKEKEKDSDFYSINEQEAYRILWPDSASIKSGSGSGSMPRGVVSQAFCGQRGNGNGMSSFGYDVGDSMDWGAHGSGDGEYIYSESNMGFYGHVSPRRLGEQQDEEEGKEEDPGIKYSRDDGSWLALQGVQMQFQDSGTGLKTRNRNSVVVGLGLGLEAKSLTLMAESNGNNKQLREEFDKRRGTLGTGTAL